MVRIEKVVGKGARALVLIPCLEVGGTEIAALQLCRALREAGFEVVVGVYHEYRERMVDQYIAAGVKVRKLDLPRLSGQPLRSFWRVFRKVRRVIAAEAPDLIHVQYMTPALAPLLAARMSGRPVLGTIHVAASHYGRRGRRMVRFAARRLCGAFVCVSEHVQRSFFGAARLYQPGGLAGGRRIFAIPNCVDAAAADAAGACVDAAALRADYGLSGLQIVGFVGRMEPIKGPDILIRAFARVAGMMPEVGLLMVGGGGRLEELKTLAETLGAAGRVVWAGRKTRGEVFRHFRIMDIAAMPSRPGLEGFGLSAAEAMACGRPVVASAVDALPEVVADGETGILVPPEDDEALADALLALLRRPERMKSMGDAGRRRVEQHFSFDLFKSRVLGLYSELLPQGKRIPGSHR